MKIRFSSCLVCDCVSTTAPLARIAASSLSAIAGDDECFFLVGADDVVVERCAEHDVAAGLVQIGRFIDDDRRVARPGADRPLAAFHRRFDDASPAGDNDQPNAGMHHRALAPIPASARPS